MRGCVHVLLINKAGVTGITWYCAILSVGFNVVSDQELPATTYMMYRIFHIIINAATCFWTDMLSVTKSKKILVSSLYKQIKI